MESQTRLACWAGRIGGPGEVSLSEIEPTGGGNSIPVAVVAATITPYAATLYQGRDGAVGVRGQMVEQSGALFFCTADKDVNNCTYWKFASLEWPSWVYPAE